MQYYIDRRLIGTYDDNTLTVTAYMVEDNDNTPYDADCYSGADIDAWRADKWRFVGIVVEVTNERGEVVGEDSIFGMEYGEWSNGRDLNPLALESDGQSWANGYGADLVDNALTAARREVGREHFRTTALRTLALFALQAVDGHAEQGVYVDEDSDLMRAADWLRSGAGRELFGDLPDGDTFGEDAETGPVWLDDDSNAAHGDGYSTATLDMVHDHTTQDTEDDPEWLEPIQEQYGSRAGEYVRGYRDGRASYWRAFDRNNASESES